MIRTIKKTFGSIIVFSIISLGAFAKSNTLKMVKIPGMSYEISSTEVTQELYQSVMGENPSYFQIDNDDLDNDKKLLLGKNTKKYPVENVTVYDAIMFCNILSVKEGRIPVYAVDGNTDPTKWDYIPHKGIDLIGKITLNASANGYRIPTVTEWQYAARGGQDFIYSGSNNLDEVGWYRNNSSFVTHSVGKKKANKYGLYDMTGNVEEWCWHALDDEKSYAIKGGHIYLYYNEAGESCEVTGGYWASPTLKDCSIGFRILRQKK